MRRAGYVAVPLDPVPLRDEYAHWATVSTRKLVSHKKVKMFDLYSFSLDVTPEDETILNDVKKRVKEQDRIWWEMEGSKGAGWYLNPSPSSSSEGTYGLSFSSIATIANGMQLKKLIRKGIPPSLRPRIWFSLSGAAKKKSSAPESYYNDLIEAVEGKVTAATRQIDHDLDRTFPAHPWLNSRAGQFVLRRILVAYSFRDSRVGYCQGMNYVAALLLLVMKTEEDAFWMLAVLLEDVLLDDTYSENLFGCHIGQRVFKDLLSNKCPRLGPHFDTLEFDVSFVATEWFLCLFAKSLPSETTMRVWDVLFNEGVNVLFRVALAIFKMREDELLSARHAGEVIKIIQGFTHRAFDPDVLLKVAFDKLGSMTMSTITKHRQKQEHALAAELEQRGQRLNSSGHDQSSSACV